MKGVNVVCLIGLVLKRKTKNRTKKLINIDIEVYFLIFNRRVNWKERVGRKEQRKTI
jgi:hypothetical protein